MVVLLCVFCTKYVCMCILNRLELWGKKVQPLAAEHATKMIPLISDVFLAQ